MITVHKYPCVMRAEGERRERLKRSEDEEGGRGDRCAAAEVPTQGNTISRSFVKQRNSSLNICSPVSVQLHMHDALVTGAGTRQGRHDFKGGADNKG